MLPGDRDYIEARSLWNGMVDRRPALIARCTNVTGNAMCDGGIVINLSLMRRGDVDVGRRMVHAEGGVLLGDLDAATQAYGLATPVGINSTTGIAGLTLGGGIGHLMRQHGLTIDNLVAVEMVTATCESVCASEDENGDLFWAVRGGGADSWDLDQK